LTLYLDFINLFLTCYGLWDADGRWGGHPCCKPAVRAGFLAPPTEEAGQEAARSQEWRPTFIFHRSRPVLNECKRIPSVCSRATDQETLPVGCHVELVLMT